MDILGVTELGVVARQARLAGKGLLPKVQKGLRSVAKPAKKHVEDQIDEKIPKRGGYAALLRRVVRVKIATDTGFTTAGVTIKTYADGQQQRRDLPALNAGRLRKKVFGNTRVWVTQKIPAGFWDDAMDATSEDAHARMREVLDETTRILMEG